MDTTQSAIVILIQLILGKFLKANPKIANGVIPWINAIIGAIANAIAPKIVHASTGGDILSAISNPIVLGFIQSIIATGIHSTCKNTWQVIKKALNLAT